MGLLHDMFCQPFRTCKSEGYAAGSRTGLHVNRPKGRAPCWKSRFWARSGNDRLHGSMRITKIRRRLARAYELQRWQSRPQSRRAQGEAEAKTLCSRLGLPQNPWSAEVCAAPEVSRELRAAEQAQKTQALQCWRHSILHEPAGMGRWLRRREQVAVTKVSGLGREARTLQVHPTGFLKRFGTYGFNSEVRSEMISGLWCKDPQNPDRGLEQPAVKRCFSHAGPSSTIIRAGNQQQ